MTRPELVAPPAVDRIVSRLNEAGFDTWAVGGALRDALLGDTGSDWDLATRARPAEVQALFPRTVPVGIDHGTVGILEGGRLYEVTTFRRDMDTDGRHAVVSYSDSIEEDLARRDFTINAIAWHPLREEWLDPFGGQDDLNDRVLRTVGSPQERFREDGLRVLRGLRFAGQLGLEVEAGTWTAMCTSTGELKGLSAERIREELMKVLAGFSPSAALSLYREAGVLNALYPELAETAGVSDAKWNEALCVVDSVRRSRSVCRLAALFRPVAVAGAQKSAALPSLLKRLRCSNAEQKNVVEWVSGLTSGPPEGTPVAGRRWLAAVGRENLPGIAHVWAGEARAQGAPEVTVGVALRIRELRAVARSGVPLTLAELAIGGNELRAMGLSPGPIFALILNQLLERVLVDPELNTPDHLRGLVPELLPDADRVRRE
jgi:tRNA nucleotidyltransferase (CCA-adding enzyme)